MLWDFDEEEEEIDTNHRAKFGWCSGRGSWF
jgi:hypothetical protein